MTLLAAPRPPEAEATPPSVTQLAAALRREIVRGALAPGTRLSEKETAERFGLSRQPVREAFIHLADEEMIEIRPQRGSYVRRISTAGVRAGRFVREAVESDVVRAAAARVAPADLDALRADVAEQRALSETEAAEFMALDERFHRRLAEIAGQAGAWAHLQPVKVQMDRVRYLTACEFPKHALVRQHAAIVAALAAGDPDTAEEAMRAHLRRVLDDLPAIVAAEPGYFDIAAEDAADPTQTT